METKLKELKTRLMEIYDLQMAAAIIIWDQSTYMPPRGAAAHGRQQGLLNRLAQERFIDPAVGKILDDLLPYAETLPPDSDDARLIQVTRRDYEQAIKVPPDFISEFFAHTAQSYHTWTKARPENDFNSVKPYLEKTLDYSRRYSDYFPGYEHVADPWIDRFDYGMKANQIRKLFRELRKELVPLVKQISDQPPPDDSFLNQHYPEETQLAFGIDCVKDFGYDFDRGRQDKSPHPFTIKFSLGDVRITTRVKENDLREALFSTLHEAGHAMYEQGIDETFEGTPLGRGTSSGVHESSSRLWENIVGRSKSFWKHYYPKLQAIFPDQLKDVSLETFYRAINKVERSLIRTDADEVTYNLHVMIRFDLELAMLEGKLAIDDLPEAWHARYKADLGIQAPTNIDGVLQDIHWYNGPIGGMFQGYTLGNIISGLLYDAALQPNPQIQSEIKNGKFNSLHGWLKENVYMHGRKFTTDELIQRITGNPLTINPYVRYLQKKFGELYTLQ
jgi:carboxypeptidase Taq